MKAFLDFPGVSKSNFCLLALNGINRKSLDKLFQRNQGRDHYLTEDTLHRIHVFLEKKRIYDQKHQGRQLYDQNDDIHHPPDA